MRIYLIGFMASGKTTLGAELASRLKWKYVDTDDLIEKAKGRSIKHIFDLEGEEYFRKEESELLRRRVCRMKNVVVATGGGMPCFNNNIDAMLRNGHVIYLDVEFETILGRLKDDGKRPLAKSKEQLRELFKSRQSIYRKGRILENPTIESLEAIVKELL